MGIRFCGGLNPASGERGSPVNRAGERRGERVRVRNLPLERPAFIPFHGTSVWQADRPNDQKTEQPKKVKAKSCLRRRRVLIILGRKEEGGGEGELMLDIRCVMCDL